MKRKEVVGGRTRQVWHIAVLGVVLVLVAGCPTGTGNPALIVAPLAINFGTSNDAQSFTITNGGSGTFAWTAVADSGWIRMDRAAGTAGATLERVTLTVNRTDQPAGSHTGKVYIYTSVGAAQVTVAMTVEGASGDVDFEVSPLTINMLDAEETETFTITNTGTGAFTWTMGFLEIDEDTGEPTSVSQPSWLDITWPTGGSTIDVGGATVVTVTVDRDTIPEGIYSYLIEITAGGDTQQVALNFAEGLAAEISVDPDVLDYGEQGTVLSFDVYNSGASGSVLDFTLSTDRPDLIVFGLPGDPPGGTSIGVDDPDDYDRVEVPVTIVRSAMSGTTDGGIITVSADGLESVDVIVNVEAAPLTFEGAQNRTRPPFILRFVFLLRDSLGAALDTTDPALYEGDDPPLTFDVYEDGELIDPDEGSIFVTSADNLRYNIILLLDYTSSMYNAFVDDDAKAVQGEWLDQMVTSSTDFIEDLFRDDATKPPRSYRLALMEYHERQQTSRMIHGFSTNPDVLKAALQDFQVPENEHGATEIWDALSETCDRLVDEDIDVLSFDDADVRAVIFITDGRDTSSIATVSEVIDKAKEARVRLYPIAFGEDVNAVDLVQMATETGGHYYPATDPTELVRLLERDEGEPPAGEGLIVKELRRQLVLTYISLFQDGSHTYLIEGDYNGLTGSFQRDGVFAVDGDIRAGQITMRTAGIDAATGTAEVYIRTEYVPRNISQFKVCIYSPRPYTIQADPNGIISDWVQVDEGAGPNGGDVYTFLTFEDNPLQYGRFGNLFLVEFSGLPPADSFDFGFRVDNGIYQNPPFTKFFQYPDSIPVSGESSQATVVPLLITDGFDPDAEFAFNRDEDAWSDFDDPYPDDPDLP